MALVVDAAVACIASNAGEQALRFVPANRVDAASASLGKSADTKRLFPLCAGRCYTGVTSKVNPWRSRVSTVRSRSAERIRT